MSDSDEVGSHSDEPVYVTRAQHELSTQDAANERALLNSTVADLGLAVADLKADGQASLARIMAAIQERNAAPRDRPPVRSPAPLHRLVIAERPVLASLAAGLRVAWAEAAARRASFPAAPRRLPRPRQRWAGASCPAPHLRSWATRTWDLAPGGHPGGRSAHPRSAATRRTPMHAQSGILVNPVAHAGLFMTISPYSQSQKQGNP